MTDQAIFYICLSVTVTTILSLFFIGMILSERNKTSVWKAYYQSSNPNAVPPYDEDNDE